MRERHNMNSEPVTRIGDTCPSNLDDEYKDERSDFLQANQFSVVGASVRGKLHARSENHNHRDDAFAGYLYGNWLIIAVADGAGSRDLSRYGAAYSVNAFCSAAMDSLHVDNLDCQDGLKKIVLQAFKNTRAGIEQFCIQHRVKPEDIHCTLLGLISNTVTGEVSVGQIGDGLILGLDSNGEARPLVEPPSPGEVGVSYFLTQLDWGKYLMVKDITKEETANLNTIYLMTDGVADDCQYGPPADILTLWARDIDREIRSSSITSLKEAENDLKAYLNTYKAQGSFDDRTLVIAYKEGKPTG
jgi:serine/threonine protein phosphatase PrpC